MKLLELFSGTATISKAFREIGFNTFTVDNDPKCSPDLCLDIQELTPEKVLSLFGRPDVIWASVPCKTFSVLAISKHWTWNKKPKSRECKENIKLLYHTLALIKALKPRIWFLENPKGMIQYVDFMQSLSRVTITYCQYGDKRQKPTFIYSNYVHAMQWKPACKAGDPCHEPAPRNSMAGGTRALSYRDRAKIPEGLARDIAQQVNQILTGGTPTGQQSLTPHHCTGLENLRSLSWKPGNYHSGSPLKWMGGKSRISREIIKLIPPHISYVEPFGGALHVLFNKPPSPNEVVNDKNDNLINLWLTIRDNIEEMEEILQNLPISEKLFLQYAQDLGYARGVQEDALVITTLAARNVERAARYYYLIRCAFNGIVRPGLSFTPTPHKTIKINRQDWGIIRDRLQRVTILSRDYADIIEKYDTPNTLFYLDPPYFCSAKRKDYYEINFSNEDHIRLSGLLKNITGKFILSLDNTTEARELYRDLNIITIPVPYTDKGELLISNYEPPQPPFYSTCNYTHGRGGNDPGSCWTIPNCPYCWSRQVRKMYAHHTIKREGGTRSRIYTPRDGVYFCEDCRNPFIHSPSSPGNDPGIRDNNQAQVKKSAELSPRAQLSLSQPRKGNYHLNSGKLSQGVGK